MIPSPILNTPGPIIVEQEIHNDLHLLGTIWIPYERGSDCKIVVVEFHFGSLNP